MAVSRRGKLVALAGEYSTTLWDASGKNLHTFPANVTKVALSDSGMHLWTACNNGTVRLWTPATGKDRCRLIPFDPGTDWLFVTRE